MFLDCLTENWIQAETSELTKGATSKPKLYVGGGFKNSTITILLSQGTVTSAPELESTQGEADTRIVLQMLLLWMVATNELFMPMTQTPSSSCSILYHSTMFKRAEHNEIWMRTSF